MRLFLFCILQVLVVTGQAQTYPQNYFRHPVDGRLLVAGTFGELRSYHFHMGLDIKANTGTPVKAAADGYLFRAKVSESGYGKVLYINHPNGYTTVYAHLSRFTDSLESFMHRAQYRQRMEEVDLSLPDTLFTFKKGDIIAWSGNTGHSAGPHLHFEVRDTKTEEAINPLLFGIKVKDLVKPTIQGIKIYPIGGQSVVEGKADGKFISLKAGKSSTYKKHIAVKAGGDIAFAFQAHDYTSESSNRCGIYEIALFQAGKKVFGQRIAHIGFDVTRFINVYKDYGEFHDHSRHLHKSYTGGNNKLQVYTEKDKDGIIHVGTDTLELYVKAWDAAGNSDSVHIKIIPQKYSLTPAKPVKCNYPLEWDKPFAFAQPGIAVNIPAGALYNHNCFHYYSRKRTAKSYSAQHAFYTNGEPVQESFDVIIQPDTLIDSVLRSKILVARTTDFKSITPYKTAYIDGRYGAQARSFGTFCLVADTLGPVIKPMGFKDSMQVNTGMLKEIAFEIKDDLSGLRTCNMYINDTWVLAHYNLKKQKLVVLPNEITLPTGFYPIRVEALDEKDNLSLFEGMIYWLKPNN